MRQSCVGFGSTDVSTFTGKGGDALGREISSIKVSDIVERGWSQVPGPILRPLTGCRSHKTSPVNIDNYAPMHPFMRGGYGGDDAYDNSKLFFETESHVANTGLELLIVLPLSPKH